MLLNDLLTIWQHIFFVSHKNVQVVSGYVIHWPLWSMIQDYGYANPGSVWNIYGSGRLLEVTAIGDNGQYFLHKIPAFESPRVQAETGVGLRQQEQAFWFNSCLCNSILRVVEIKFPAHFSQRAHWCPVEKERVLKTLASVTFAKGAQAWDIRRRVFYAIQACMGSWLRN